MELLAAMNRQRGCTVLVSLHQVEFATRYCPRTIALHRGAVVYDGLSSALTPALLSDLYGSDVQDLFDPARCVSPPVEPAEGGSIATLMAQAVRVPLS